MQIPDLSSDGISLAPYIDHTLLKPEATPKMIHKLSQEALTHGFKSVCVNSHWVATAAENLAGSAVAVCAVVGFPLGAIPSQVKTLEAEMACRAGARELDMVMAIGALKAGLYDFVAEDIKSVRKAAGDQIVLKVIIETALLDKAEISKACDIACAAGADFVKTSTGFASGGATVEDVALMRRTVGPQIGVKASGGIKDAAAAMAMIEAGASRIGTSSGVTIINSSAP